MPAQETSVSCHWVQARASARCVEARASIEDLGSHAAVHTESDGEGACHRHVPAKARANAISLFLRTRGVSVIPYLDNWLIHNIVRRRLTNATSAESPHPLCGDKT